MTLIMGGRSLKLLYAIFTLLLHLEPALARVISGVGDGNMWCIERERQALLELKKGLIDGHNMLSSWGSEDAKKNCCSWEGVQCSYQTGHVVQLYLTDDNLIGPISSQIGNLSHLQSLYINSINLKISSLEWLSHIVSIEHLDLSYVSLSVTNDWQRVVSCLPKLSELRLSNCSLPSITPSSLSHINSSKSLTDLDLSFNPRITSLIFPWLFNSSTNLTSLDLSSNQITGSVPNFAIFPSLRDTSF